MRLQDYFLCRNSWVPAQCTEDAMLAFCQSRRAHCTVPTITACQLADRQHNYTLKFHTVKKELPNLHACPVRTGIKCSCTLVYASELPFVLWHFLQWLHIRCSHNFFFFHFFSFFHSTISMQMLLHRTTVFQNSIFFFFLWRLDALSTKKEKASICTTKQVFLANDPKITVLARFYRAPFFR